jgi:hypothetical protein
MLFSMDQIVHGIEVNKRRDELLEPRIVRQEDNHEAGASGMRWSSSLLFKDMVGGGSEKSVRCRAGRDEQFKERSS